MQQDSDLIVSFEKIKFIFPESFFCWFRNVFVSELGIFFPWTRFIGGRCSIKTYHEIFLDVIRMILVWELSSSFTSNIYLCHLINICFPWNHQKTIDFLTISRRIEVQWFAWIRLILDTLLKILQHLLQDF